MVTLPLYGAIPPSVTRASVIALLFRDSPTTTLPRLRAPMRIRPDERVLTIVGARFCLGRGHAAGGFLHQHRGRRHP